MVENRLRKGDRLHGFEVKKVSEIGDVRSIAIELEHVKSGAKLLHLLNDDVENLIAIALRTPPEDDTGLPHILEHTVLCGSEKYPVKDPFVELLKTSLATFLNAMTYPDKTVYPCASMNEKDFFNIASVYCDAVFKPLITEKHFKQEGHHFDFAQTQEGEEELIIKGIVYNEMKGAYSDLDGTIDKYESAELFTDNEYGNDSGGDPDKIPQLTYENFVNFHKKYYHPTNSYIFIYGNIETEKHLAFLSKNYLDKYERIAIDTSIKEQSFWDEPRQKTISYPASTDDTPETKSAVTLSWFTDQSKDAVKSLAMNVLDDYLLGNAGAPLRKAIIDSKLGEDLTNAGYADYQRDTFFSVGIKGTGSDKGEDFLKVVLETCQAEVDKGVNKEMIDAAFHHLEMSALSIPSQYPLRLMDRVYRSWLYDEEPTYNLNLRQKLQKLSDLYKLDERYFEKLITEKIIENPHRLLLTFVPDHEYNSRKDKEFKEKMAAVRSQLSEVDVSRIKNEAKELEIMQQSGNTPEALATLPKLSRNDVSKLPLEFEYDKVDCESGYIMDNKIYTGGLNYVHISINLSDLAGEMLEYLPVFAEVLGKVGAGGLDYATFAQKEVACSSGVSASVEVSGKFAGTDVAIPYLNLSVRGAERKLSQMLEVLRERLLDFDLSDVDRIKDIILQARVGRKAAIVGQGHTYASVYAGKNISQNLYLKELLLGVAPIRLFDKLAEEFSAEKLIAILDKIREKILDAGRFDLSIAGSEESRKQIMSWYKDLLNSIGKKDFSREDRPSLIIKPVANTAVGLAVPADVAFVARALPAVSSTSELAPALALLSQNLSYGYLWNEVRAKRGAYGCKAGALMQAATYMLASYRDPCILETLETYSSILSYITEEMDLSDTAIEQAVIGTIKNFDVPFRPAQVVVTAMAQLHSEVTYEERLKFRTDLLNVGKQTIISAAEKVFSADAFAKSAVCVLSSREKLEQACANGFKAEIESL